MVVLAGLASAVNPTQRRAQEALAVLLQTVALRAVAPRHVDAVRSHFVLERCGSALHGGSYSYVARLCQRFQRLCEAVIIYSMERRI